MSGLSAREQVIVAVDAEDRVQATMQASAARHAGAKTIMIGSKTAGVEGWLYGCRLAGSQGLEWVADAKLDDNPDEVAGAVRRFGGLVHPPVGITIHTTAGTEAMRAAQEVAGGSVKMLGVTILDSISDAESRRIYRMSRTQKIKELAQDAARAGLAGLVCSPYDVDMIKGDPETAGLFKMVNFEHIGGPGDRPDVPTPAEAILASAGWVVLGSRITEAEDPGAALQAVFAEIEGVPPHGAS